MSVEEIERIIRMCTFVDPDSLSVGGAHKAAVGIAKELAAQQSVQRTCFYCDENKPPAKEAICQDCVDLLSDASR